MKKLIKLTALVCVLTALLIPGVSMAAHDFDYDHIQSGYGSKSGTDLGNASWSLEVTTSYANSQGYLFNGATGDVFCGVTASDNWQSTDVANSNSLTVYGDGSWAEIWFHNVV